MGYFENLAETAFKKGANGDILFHRWGIFGKPYVVPGPDQKEDVKKFVTRFYLIGLPLGIFCGIALRGASLFIIPILLIYYEVGIRKKIAGWQRSAEKLTINQAYSNNAKIFPLWFLWSGAVVSAIFVLAGVFIILKSEKVLVGASSIALFGLCLAAYLKMLLARKSRGPDQSKPESR